MAAEIQVDEGKPLNGGINRKKVKDGQRDEQSKGVEEQTSAERRWRQESNLVKSEWDVLFLNVERGGHFLGEKEKGDREIQKKNGEREKERQRKTERERQRKKVKRK